MKFANKYPIIQLNAKTANEDGLIESEEKKPCVMCGEETEFIEIYSEGRFCSEECMNKFYDEFQRKVSKFL